MNDVVLVFPKLFELCKFYAWGLKEKDLVGVTPVKGRFARFQLWEFFFKETTIICALVDESDIGFHISFQDLLRELPDARGKCFILVGSAGAVNEDDVGKVFWVRSAVKGDRGRVDERGLFHRRRKKQLAHECRLPPGFTSLMEQRIAVSVCFFNETCLDEDWGDLCVLFDMETFNFFHLCHEEKVAFFGCVRFVTDKVARINSKFEPQDYWSLKNDQLVPDVEKYLSYFFKNRKLLPDDMRDRYGLTKFMESDFPETQFGTLKDIIRVSLVVDFKWLFTPEILSHCKAVRPERNDMVYCNAVWQEEFVKKVVSKATIRVSSIAEPSLCRNCKRSKKNWLEEGEKFFLSPNQALGLCGKCREKLQANDEFCFVNRDTLCQNWKKKVEKALEDSTRVLNLAEGLMVAFKCKDMVSYGKIISLKVTEVSLLEFKKTGDNLRQSSADILVVSSLDVFPLDTVWDAVNKCYNIRTLAELIQFQ